MAIGQPNVDVVIAARNEERRLREVLGALKSQDYPSELVRVIVVDNGSGDATAAIAQSHGATTLFLPGGNVGAVRNLGIRSGGGELVAFIDAHCVPEPSWLTSMVAAFTDDSVGGCAGPFKYVCANERLKKLTEVAGLGSEQRILRELMTGKISSLPWIPTGNAVYRRRALEQSGLFDESLRYCEDVDLSWRVILLGYRLTAITIPLVTHYNDDSSASWLDKQFKLGTAMFRMGVKYQMPNADVTPYENTEDSNIALISSNCLTVSRIGPGTLLLQQRSLAEIAFHAGFRLEGLLSLLSLRPKPIAGSHLLMPVLPQFRPSFGWDDRTQLRISDRVVYWFIDPLQCVIVSASKKQRYLIRDVGAVIWSYLANTGTRQETMLALTSTYSVSAEEAAQDVDAFLSELLHEGLVLPLDGAKNGFAAAESSGDGTA